MSLKILKYGVRGHAADNPPEVDICKMLTANSTYLLQNTDRPLTLDAWPTLPGRLFDDELQSRPSASFHPRGRASRRPSKSGRLAAVHQSPCMLSSPRCPSQRMRGPLRVQKSAFAALLLSQTTTSACVGGNDLCRQSEFPWAASTLRATHAASLPDNALHKPSL